MTLHIITLNTDKVKKKKSAARSTPVVSEVVQEVNKCLFVFCHTFYSSVWDYPEVKRA